MHFLQRPVKGAAFRQGSEVVSLPRCTSGGHTSGGQEEEWEEGWEETEVGCAVLV